MKKLILLALCIGCAGQATVLLMPVPRLQFLDESGRPLAFGCVFSFQSGTTNALPTYTDSTGQTLNPNPVILSAGGSANIWIQAGQSYSIRVKTSGKINCATGNTLYTINGVGGGTSTLTTVVPFTSTPSFVDTSQNQLFKLTLTDNAASLPFSAVGVNPPGFVVFEITQDSSGNHTFAWPTNVVGGASISSSSGSVTTQEFVWDGTVLTALGPAIVGPNSLGTPPHIRLGDIVATGSITAQGDITTLGNLSGQSITINGNPVGAATCADGTASTVNANTTANQIVKSCVLPSGVLNTVNKAFRLTTQMVVDPVASADTVALFVLGNTLPGITRTSTTSDEISASSPWETAFTVTCVTNTTGSAGSISCTKSTIAGSGVRIDALANVISPIDLTGPLFVGSACSFSAASTSNNCTSNMMTVELLN